MPKLAERRTADIVVLDDALRFMRVVWNLQHALQSISKRMERTLGVTGAQRLAMRVIGTVPGITSAELARVLHLDPSTISGILERLVTKRLITRLPDDTDRRLRRLQLTSSGRRLNRPSKRGTIESAVRATLQHFPDAKIQTAVNILDRLSGSLTSRSQPYSSTGASAR